MNAIRSDAKKLVAFGALKSLRLITPLTSSLWKQLLAAQKSRLSTPLLLPRFSSQRSVLCLVVLLLFRILPASSWCGEFATVITKKGDVFSGEILKKTSQGIVIRTDGLKRTGVFIPYDRIESPKFDPPPSPPPENESAISSGRDSNTNTSSNVTMSQKEFADAINKESDEKNIRLITITLTNVLVAYRGVYQWLDVAALPPNLQNEANTKWQQQEEERKARAERALRAAAAQGLIREVDGVTYDLRLPQKDWTTFMALTVFQCVDDGYLVFPVYPRNTFGQSSIVFLRNKGVEKPLVDGQRLRNIDAMRVGAYTYITKSQDRKTIPAYDLGTPVEVSFEKGPSPWRANSGTVQQSQKEKVPSLRSPTNALERHVVSLKRSEVVRSLIELGFKKTSAETVNLPGNHPLRATHWWPTQTTGPFFDALYNANDLVVWLRHSDGVITNLVVLHLMNVAASTAEQKARITENVFDQSVKRFYDVMDSVFGQEGNVMEWLGACEIAFHGKVTKAAETKLDMDNWDFVEKQEMDGVKLEFRWTGMVRCLSVTWL
jgi:hypothetical protein